MHVVFIPYGIKQAVDHLMIDMQAQKFDHIFTKDDKKMKTIVQGSLRLMPFGIWEYVFPSEYGDIVMKTLDFDLKDQRYIIPEKLYGIPIQKIMRKILKLEEIPKISSDIRLPWIKQNVHIIPLGLRHDAITTVEENVPIYGGWTHEAL